MAVKTTDTRKLPPQNTLPDDKSPSKTAQKSEFSVSKELKNSEESCPFRRLIYDWLAYCRADGLSERTITDYSDKAFKFYWWWNEHTHYTEQLGAHPRFVSTEKAREFTVYLRTSLEHRWGVKVLRNRFKLSNASLESYGRAVKVFFNWLEREGHIKQTPFNRSVRFTSRHKQDKTIKRLESEELERIFDVLTDPARLSTFLGCRDLAIISLLLDSGIRLGELLSIRLCDLDLEQNRCQVTGKTGKRIAIFSERCRTYLLNYLKHPKNPCRIAANHNFRTDTSALWITSDGLPLSYYGCESVIRRLKRDSGVDFHPHQLRHTFASLMAAQGTSVFDLKEMLGHTSISTTQIYVNQSIEHLSEVHRARSPLNSVSLDQEVSRGRGRRRKWN